jgi:hypothetical protein
MAMIHTILHYGSYAAAFYAAYVVVGMAISGVFLWRVLRQPAAVRRPPYCRPPPCRKNCPQDCSKNEQARRQFCRPEWKGPLRAQAQKRAVPFREAARRPVDQAA